MVCPATASCRNATSIFDSHYGDNCSCCDTNNHSVTARYIIDFILIEYLNCHFNFLKLLIVWKKVTTFLLPPLWTE